ncbi:MAG TPA: phage major capsid protein, partial [Hyphomicrobiaceae bacterium]|nr:phage major capsid protein [Hyphomicrobiaceae bacterium]
QATILAEIGAQKDSWKKEWDELKAQGVDASEKTDRALRRLDEVELQVKKVPESIINADSGITIGEYIAGNEAFQAVAKKFTRDTPTGTVLTKGVQCEIAVPGGFFLNPEIKTTITSSTVGSSTPGILVPSRVSGIVPPGVRRVRVRDLIPRFPTTSNAIEFVKENAFTNASSPTAEASAAPESALTFTIDYENVKRISTFIPTTKIILSDAPALGAYINQRLMDGLRDIEDVQLLTGDGTGNNLSGLDNEADAYETARNASADTKLDKLNHAISQIESDNLYPSGIIMHPNDWRKIQLTKDAASNVGNYILGGPAGNATPMIWGLPVATSTAVSETYFYVGAFTTHTALWDRQEATVEVSTDYDDYFVKGMVAIMAEERVAFTCYRSDAVVYGTF